MTLLHDKTDGFIWQRVEGGWQVLYFLKRHARVWKKLSNMPLFEDERWASRKRDKEMEELSLNDLFYIVL